MIKKKGKKRKCKEILHILNDLRENFAVFGYLDALKETPIEEPQLSIIERFPTEFKKLDDKIMEEDDPEARIALPLHLERAYEILAEKGCINKKELIKNKEELIKRYWRFLRFNVYTMEDMNFPIDNNPLRSIKEIEKKSKDYEKILGFYKDNIGESCYMYEEYLNILKHIQAMITKTKLDTDISNYSLATPEWPIYTIGELSEERNRMRKNILVCLAEGYYYYTYNGDKEYSKKEEKQRNSIYKKAKKQIDFLFPTESIE